MRPVWSHDSAANAAYLRLSREPVFESKEISQNIVLDYDADGKIVGMEILDAIKLLTPGTLNEAA